MPRTNRDVIADALLDTLRSPNEADSNFEIANVVDVIAKVARGCYAVSRAITADAAPGRDAKGGTVASLTESVMGITAALSSIATSLESAAETIAGALDRVAASIAKESLS